MRKFINYLSVTFLLLAFFFIFSCGDEEEIKPIVDYRCKVITRSAVERIYCNTPIPITVEIEKNDPTVGKYTFSYTTISGEGDLFINENKIGIREEVPIDLENFTPRYVPRKLGEHKLKFRFENEEYVTESMYVIQANDLVFEASAVNLPRKLLIDKPLAFDLQLKQKNESSEATLFNAQLQMLKGKGYVTFIGTEDTASLKAFSIISDSIINQIVPGTKSIGDYKIRIGNNKVHFKSAEEGENVILLNVENEYGYKQELSVPLNIELPDFTVCTTTKSSGSVGTVNNFLLNIADVDNFGENQYNVTYRNIKNSGKLKINNNEIQVGATLQIPKGDNVCEFIPQSLGETMLEFIVKDRYNTTRKDTLSFNSERSYVDISVSPYDTTATIYDNRSISFAVNKKDYTGKYYLDLTQEPSGTASIKVNGADYAGGRIQITNIQNTLISFVPKSTGKMNFTVRVYDDYNSESTAKIPFTVGNSTGKLFVSGQKPSVNIFSESYFSFGINKPNYTGKFYYDITQKSGLIPGTFGKIKINGKEYKGGREEVSNINNTAVSFIPEKMGEIILTVSVYDEFGGVIGEDLHYSVSNTDIRLSVENQSKDLILSQETFLTFTPSKPFYEGKLMFKVMLEPAVAGILRIDGQSYLQGQMMMVSNNAPVKISFTPNSEGTADLLLNVYDEWGASVKYPISYQISNPPISLREVGFKNDVIVNTDNTFTVTASKNNYKEGFTYNIISKPVGAGVIKVNDILYNGTVGELPANTNTRICFSPKVTGEIILTLTVTDKMGGNIKREYVYNATNPDLQVLLSDIEDGLTIFKQSYFHLNVTKPNYSGKFFCEVEGENVTGMQLASSQYTNGSRVELTNPTGTKFYFIPTKVGRDTVKIKFKISDEWGKTSEKKLSFSVTNSDISVMIPEHGDDLLVGKETVFKFVGSKPNYSGKLKYEIKTTPSGYGTIKVNGKDYISGQYEFINGETVPVNFIPLKEGSVNVKVTISDEWGGEKSSSFNYAITSTPIIQEFQGYTSQANLEQEKVFTMSLRKLYYAGDFNISVSMNPANAGKLKINNSEYTGGVVKISDPLNTKISFTPTQAGESSLIIEASTSDNIGKNSKALDFKVINNPITIFVNNQKTGLIINRETSFNFAVQKIDYTKKFQFEVITDPVSVGTYRINGEDYKGGRKEIKDIHNTEIFFTPNRTGDFRMKLRVYDEFGGTQDKELTFTVANSEFSIHPANVEKDIYHGLATTFNFSVLKPYYSGNYKYEIIQTPENTGDLIINGNAYRSGLADLTLPAESKVQFTSHTTGLNTLTIKVYDEHGGSTTENIIFNCISSEIDIRISNKEEKLIYNTATFLNAMVIKEKYTSTFSYEIEQIPAASGTISVDGKAYNGGIAVIDNPDNLRIGFTPTREGHVSLKLTVTDKIGGRAEKLLEYDVANAEIKVDVVNQIPDILVNTESSFNFSVSKANYTGKLYYQISQEPAGSGTIKVNGTAYSGVRTPITDLNNNTISFTANKPGAVTLNLTVSDDWNKETVKLVNYSVSNTDIKVNVTEKEYDLALNKSTTVKFNVSKPGYTGSFTGKITIEPENAGTVKLNNIPYAGTEYTDILTGNTLEFTPTKAGATLLKLTIKDEHGGEKEVAVNYKVSNPDLAVEVTNRETELLYNTATSFNASVSKSYYSDGFDFQIEQIPAASGTITVDGKAYNGGTQAVTNPQNILIGFTPTREGRVSLKLRFKDKVGGVSEQLLDFNVTNPELKLSVTNHTADLMVNSSGTFNFTVTKANYGGKFKYQISQEPAGIGTMQVNNADYNGALTELSTPGGTKVTFTPSKTGAITLKLTVTDEWGKTASQNISYSVSNTDIKVQLANKENDLILGKATSLNFTVSKAGYTGSFEAKVIQEPAGAGVLKLNSSAHNSGYASITASNSLEFTPKMVGAALLKLVVKDDLGGEKEVALNFNVTNPDIVLNVTNKEDNLNYNVKTSFNVSMSKEFYNGTFDFEVEQLPAASGSLEVDGKAYSGGLQAVTNALNLRISFTPTHEGRITLKLRIKDKVGGEKVEMLDFNVVSAPISLTLNGPASTNMTIGQSTTFTMKATKDGYSGSFNYEITPYPIDGGNLIVNGKTGLTGVLNPNPSTVSFTPTKLGTAIFTVKVTDSEGKSATQTTYVNVTNSPILISFANNENNVVLNNPTNFVFKTTKADYPDSKNITYTISPAYTGTLVVDGKAYTGTSISIPYSRIKNGINVTYSPDREGERGLTFVAEDEFGGTDTKSLLFSVSNPELQLYLTGVNTSTANEATLGSTYKFYYNISKPNYNDDFSYWLTLDPQAVGIIGTSDATPRGRSGGGVDMQTGTIKGNANGVTTGEIRFTPSNTDYLDKEITVNVRIRDKWNNEKEQTVKFKIVTSAIEINVNRKTSIDVEVPYTFYFTVTKPGYTGSFKYSLVGWADRDKLEVSADNSKWTTYAGGKFDLPNKDHTYIRYTPAAINTIPLRLFVYDEQNGEAMQELTFDVKAPEVKLTADATMKTGYLNEFVPFALTAQEGKGENMNLGFTLDDPSFSGELKFNNNTVTPASSRARTATSSFNITSGASNKLEIMSRSKGTWGTTATATNRWQQSASVTTIVQVDKKPNYTLTTSQTGEGSIKKSPDQPTYESGTIVTLTATSTSGWRFVKWTGDVSSIMPTITVTMNSDKNVQAVFEEDDEIFRLSLPSATDATGHFDIKYDKVSVSENGVSFWNLNGAFNPQLKKEFSGVTYDYFEVEVSFSLTNSNPYTDQRVFAIAPRGGTSTPSFLEGVTCSELVVSSDDKSAYIALDYNPYNPNYDKTSHFPITFNEVHTVKLIIEKGQPVKMEVDGSPVGDIKISYEVNPICKAISFPEDTRIGIGQLMGANSQYVNPGFKLHSMIIKGRKAE